MKDVIRDFPARLLTPDERALVAEWIACAGDIAEAYVSNRRVDDPALYHRIVIVTNPEAGRRPCPRANPVGNLDRLFIGPRTKVQRFRTLRAALNSVRPVLVETGLKECSAYPDEIVADMLGRQCPRRIRQRS